MYYPRPLTCQTRILYFATEIHCDAPDDGAAAAVIDLCQIQNSGHSPLCCITSSSTKDECPEDVDDDDGDEVVVVLVPALLHTHPVTPMVQSVLRPTLNKTHPSSYIADNLQPHFLYCVHFITVTDLLLFKNLLDIFDQK